MAGADRETFIRANTALIAPPHVPEIRLRLADEAHDLWLKSEEELGIAGLPPPFWAFAWAGGQGLARHILDNREIVAGKDVLDIGSGSGLLAIAAMLAGAASALAADTDPFAGAALALNAAANGVAVGFTSEDLIGTGRPFDVVLAGDVFYDKAMADRLVPWFDHLARRGTLVLVGDPGRSYLPKTGLERISVYEVPVLRALEDSEVKRTTVWRYVGKEAGNGGA